MNILQLKLVLRNLVRYKLHSSINIIGFAISIAVFIMISLYVNYNLNFDRFHTNRSHIYKVFIGDKDGIAAPVVNILKANFSEIETTVRHCDWYGGGRDGYLRTEAETYSITDLLFADNTLFDVFNFEAIQGDVKAALQQPNTILLTKSYARKIYGSEDPTGQLLKYQSKSLNIKFDLTVMGVIEDAPSNSTIKYNSIVSMSTIPANHIRRGKIDEDWGNWGFSSYVKINNESDFTQLNDKAQSFWSGFVLEKWGLEPNTEAAANYQLSFVPLEEVHFHGSNKRTFIYVLMAIGLIILIVAIINYVNLSMAIFSSRIKEIGIKKVIGSTRINMFWQLINESLVITTISSILSLLLILAFNPYFTKITGFNDLLGSGNLIIYSVLFIAGIVITGIVSGVYPALYLTSLSPINALKKERITGKKGGYLKNSLVVFQFVVSITLIIGVIIISGQVNHMKSKELGYETDHVVYFSQSGDIGRKYDVFKQKLLSNPNIKSVCRTNTHLGRDLNMSTKHKVNGEFKKYMATTIDPDFVKTMGIKLIAGRDLSWDIRSDLDNAVLVNEQFVKKMELDPALGSIVSFLDTEVTVVGVVKNFHNTSMHHEIEPSLFTYRNWNSYVNIKIGDMNVAETIAFIDNTWGDFAPEMPFEYQFLDNTYDKLYKSDEELGFLIWLFSILAVCIASLGLLGLISFTTQQRKKEIGVRKINGAKIYDVVSMLNRDILKWVGIAFIIACPVSGFLMSKWLQTFAYRIELSWWIFALAGVLALGIALLTVSWQSWRAATRNPVEALRYE
jgi:putative ABC transport system permease protein